MFGRFYALARKCKRSNMLGLRRLVNLMYYDPDSVVLTKRNFDYVAVDGFKFRMSDQIDSVQRVDGNPWFAKVLHTDTILDIGANIGAIAIPLAAKAKRVFAVEPLFGNELRANIALNGLENIKVLDYALGSGSGVVKIAFGCREGLCQLMPFKLLKEITGPVDFLKVDCEGAEWVLEPFELKGIRELRIEFHIRRGNRRGDLKKLGEWYEWLRSNGYIYTVIYGAEPGPCVPFSQCVLLNASLVRDVEGRRQIEIF